MYGTTSRAASSESTIECSLLAGPNQSTRPRRGQVHLALPGERESGAYPMEDGGLIGE